MPPPFNIMPTVKSFVNLLKRMRGKGKKASDKYKGAGEAQVRHQDIMRCILKRYVSMNNLSKIVQGNQIYFWEINSGVDI